jgi:hypothetical protein
MRDADISLELMLVYRSGHDTPWNERPERSSFLEGKLEEVTACPST